MQRQLYFDSERMSNLNIWIFVLEETAKSAAVTPKVILFTGYSKAQCGNLLYVFLKKFDVNYLNSCPFSILYCKLIYLYAPKIIC
jgi:hypothetical protein